MSDAGDAFETGFNGLAYVRLQPAMLPFAIGVNATFQRFDLKDAVVTTFNNLHETHIGRNGDEVIEGLLSLDVTQAALLKAIRNITPLSVLKKEEIEELHAWSHQRARPASKSLFLQRAESLSDTEKRGIAIHEAGHVVLMKYHFNKTPAFISIDNYKNYAAFIPVDEAVRTTYTKRDLEKEIGVIMGGMVAEDEAIGGESKTVGASHDLIQATGIGRKMVVEYGFGGNKSVLKSRLAIKVRMRKWPFIRQIQTQSVFFDDLYRILNF